MLSIHFRFLLTATLFSPVLLLFCINDFIYRWTANPETAIDKNPPLIIWIFIATSILLAVSCFSIMKRIMRQATPCLLRVKTFSRRDQGALSFVLIFLLPFVRIADVLSTAQYMLYIVIFIVITIVVSDISAYQYNLVMRILGYRFYVIKDRDDIDCLLITRKRLRTPDIERDVIQLYEDVYIAINEDKYDS